MTVAPVTHRLRHVIKQLDGCIPDEVRNGEAVRELAGYGCLTRMHVVRLLAPRVDKEDHTKDVDFSPAGIRTRWEASYENARRAIDLAPWRGEFGPLDGVILRYSSVARRALARSTQHGGATCLSSGGL